MLSMTNGCLNEIVGYKNFQASLCKCVDYEQSLLFLGPSSNTRETRICVIEGASLPRFLRQAARRSCALALPSLNLKKRETARSLQMCSKFEC